MKILYLHQYFNTNKGSTRSYEIASHLVSRQHQVTMITGSDTETCDGMKIISTKTKYKQEHGYLQRLLSFIHYMYKSFFIGLKEKNIDVIYASSTPLTIGLIGLLLAKIKRCKFIFEVRDLWPDIPIELGIIRNYWLKKILFMLEKVIYIKADKIIVLSPGMKEDLLRKGVNQGKIFTVTNFADIDYFAEITPQQREEAVKKLGQEGKFICLYAGTLGFVNNIDYILNLAEQTEDPDIVYVIVGNGKEKERLVRIKQEKQLNNVIFLDQVPKKVAYAYMSICHVGMVIAHNYESLNRNSANKLFDFWGAGKPTLINYKGWQHGVMEKYMAGHGFEYNELLKMKDYVVTLKNNHRLYSNIVQNIKQLAQDYEKTKLVTLIETIIINTVEDK
ncbi:glycosyltransferase family 4 protein [Cytobacillus horneckiae]|uniref:glycosyltransferase family 4 protein n=1 Tax=Cytobacillus horneckiae TaxID=549687 RepID=UPI003D9A23CB